MDAFGGFQAWLRANGCSENTIEDRLGVLVAFAHTHPGFPHVSPAQITDWLGRPGYAQWTHGAYYGHLHSYFTFALDAGVVAADPMARMHRPRSGKSVPRPLSEQQVAVVMAAARPNLRAWLTLGLYAGLRAHEIAKIRAEDVEADQLWVLGKGGEGVYLPTHPAIWALAASMPLAWRAGGSRRRARRWGM